MAKHITQGFVFVAFLPFLGFEFWTIYLFLVIR